MSPKARVRVIVIATLASAAFALSLLMEVALSTGGEVVIGRLSILRIAAGYERRAAALLANSASPPQEVRAEAARLSREAINEYPYDTAGWLRLAYVDSLNHNGISAEGVALLERSYDLIAVDPDLALWRVRFALENSQALPRPLRNSVRSEVTALWNVGKNRQPLRKMATTIQNPAGRLSLALWLNGLAAGVSK